MALLLNRKLFQTTFKGQPTDLFVLRNKNEVFAAITNYGARLVSLFVPDKSQKLTDVVLGFDSIEQYLQSPDPYYGCVIGRFANRIAGGSFKLEGKTYSLPVNNDRHHLHGGPHGFHKKVWNFNQISDTRLELTCESTDGEEGYPGNLKIMVGYELTDDNALHIQYGATTDKKTILNLTHHAFFNLQGEGSGSIDKHVLQVDADYFTPVDASLIPTGELRSVANTPFDFRKEHAIGLYIDQVDDQLNFGKGYDHNFVLRKQNAELERAALVYAPETGISLEVLTTEPGMQLYTGNFMMGRNKLKSGAPDSFRSAFCLETQHFPDSPNHPEFPSTVIDPALAFYSKTVYRFSVR